MSNECIFGSVLLGSVVSSQPRSDHQLSEYTIIHSLTFRLRKQVEQSMENEVLIKEKEIPDVKGTTDLWFMISSIHFSII